MLVSICQQLIDAFTKPVHSETSGVDLDGVGAVVNESERRLVADLICPPDLAGVIHRVGEVTNIQFIDEGAYWLDVVSTCDPDKGDLVTVDSLDLCDRRGFSATSCSPRGPKPEHYILARKASPIQLAAVSGVNQHSRVGHRLGFRNRTGGSSLRG